VNLETINQELKQKFKKMSPEQFDEYVRDLRKLYLSQHPRYKFVLDRANMSIDFNETTKGRMFDESWEDFMRGKR